MCENRLITFTGKLAIPSLKREMRNKILSTYSNEEINHILDSINTDSPQGKEMYAIICLVSFLGLRAADVVNLRFDEINWESNILSIIQQKNKSAPSSSTNHSIRHTRAMHLLESGVNLIYIRDILGHTSVVTTEIYARINPKIKEKIIKEHSALLNMKDKYSQKQKKDLLKFLKAHDF